MALGRLLYPANPAFDADGEAPLGARITVYENGTTTLVAIYADTDSTPLANPYTASAARLPEVWASTAAQFTILVEIEVDTGVWQTLYSEDDITPLGAVNPAPQTVTHATALTVDDLGRNIYASGTFALTLPAGTTLFDGWRVRVINEGTGVVTLTAQSPDLIGTASTKAVLAGALYDLEWTGSVWKAVAPATPAAPLSAALYIAKHYGGF